MGKLVVSLDGVVIKEVQLTKDRTTLGRRPYNDIVIDNLAVSGEHALIVTILNDSFLEDGGDHCFVHPQLCSVVLRVVFAGNPRKSKRLFRTVVVIRKIDEMEIRADFEPAEITVDTE